MTRPWLFVAIAVAGALALGLLLPREPGGLVVPGMSGDTTTPTDPSTPTTGESTTTEATETGDLEEVVAEISEFVEHERGLEFLRPVTVELADDDEFEARLLEDFDEEAPALEASGVTLKALGILDPDLDVVEAYATLLGIGVVGFYDPTTDELVVRGTEPTPYVRQVIAHELVHALDDQHFELDRPELEDTDDEQGFGFSALVEGNASRIGDLYLASLSDEERDEAFAEEIEVGSDPAVFTVPPVLIDILVAPYTLGPDLVEAVLDAGGQPRLDEAFEAPPTTTEQVLDPERFLAGEGPLLVTAPSADGPEVERGVFGAFGLDLLLSGIDDDTADEAVDGWGGDAYVTWRTGDNACTRLVVVGDTAADAAELEQALTEWAGDADVEATVSAGADGTVTLTSCVTVE